MNNEEIVTPAIIFADLVRYSQSLPHETKAFRNLTHNKDLCARFYDQAERILSGFDKYSSISYDIQGMRDGGTDVVIRYSKSIITGGQDRFISLQIKSFDEFEKNDGLVSKIKSQIYESEKDYGESLDKYYLLLCTDHTKHLNFVRYICAELRNDSRVIVVQPRYAWQFYNMKETIIDAVVDLFMYPEDYIRKRAKEEIRFIGKEQLTLILSCLVYSIENNNNGAIPNDVLTSLAMSIKVRSKKSDAIESVSKYVSDLEDTFLHWDSDSDVYRLKKQTLDAVIAMYYDTLVRYGHRGEAAIQYLSAFLEKTSDCVEEY